MSFFASLLQLLSLLILGRDFEHRTEVKLSNITQLIEPTREIGEIGGFYTDPKLYSSAAGSFAGCRMISDIMGDTPSTRLTLIGSDNGEDFWTIYGNWTDKANGIFTVEFSATLGKISGKLSSGTISWKSGEVWTRMGAPAFQTDVDASGKKTIAGFYHDPNHFKEGSWGGTRMISDDYGSLPTNTLTLIGSDDGVKFWTILGQWTDKSKGELSVDFSPKGGPPRLAGVLSSGRITWTDGNGWSRQRMVTILHL